MTLTPPNERVLGLILFHGCAERYWVRPSQVHTWQWRVGDQQESRNVDTLYAKGMLCPDRGDPHRLVVSDEGRAYLAQRLERAA